MANRSALKVSYYLNDPIKLKALAVVLPTPRLLTLILRRARIESPA
jgi:hypothetical protein